MIIGDLTICEPEEERFNVRNQTFTEGDAGKTDLVRTFFPHALEIAQPNLTSKDTTSCFPESTERSLTCPWQKHEIFIAALL